MITWGITAANDCLENMCLHKIPLDCRVEGLVCWECTATFIFKLTENIENLTQQVSQIAAKMETLVSITMDRGEAARLPSPDGQVCDPEPFSGNLDRCREFLLQSRLVPVFQHRPCSSTTDAARELNRNILGAVELLDDHRASTTWFLRLSNWIIISASNDPPLEQPRSEKKSPAEGNSVSILNKMP